jgi:hypothetical protein
MSRSSCSREWIASLCDAPVGWVRLAEYPDGDDITIVVAPERRCEHLATPIIVAACAETRRPVLAVVEAWNHRSTAAFISAGFRVAREEDPGRTLLRFERES